MILCFEFLLNIFYLIFFYLSL